MAVQKKVCRYIVLICILFSGANTFSQSNYLYKKISCSFIDIPLEKALNQIAEKGGFTFSYNSKHFNEGELVSLNTKNKSVSKSLDLLFDNSVKYKVVGSHLVLMRKKTSSSTNREDQKNDYIMSGYIIDSKTGEKIKEATVYEINGEIVTLSNSGGFYSLTVPPKKGINGLSYSKRGYLDTIIIVSPVNNQNFDISLTPITKSIPKIEPKSVNVKLKDLHNRPVVDFLVPHETKIISDNIEIHEYRKYQISFVPYISTNYKLGGAVDNNYSFNILAGYTGGINGFELGGILNMVRRDVNGAQIAGVANMVGGNTNFFQLAGMFNLNSGSVSGVQVGGFSNVVLDTINGIQIAGFQNTLHGYMNGIQLSGFNNLTTENVDGVQLTGFANVALKDVKTAQIGGFANYAVNIDGIQLAGFANVANGDVNWGQASGFANYGKNINGTQLAGFANIAEGDVNWGQASGFANYGNSVKGIQAAGFANVAQGEVTGGQLAGFANYAKAGGEIQASGFANVAMEEVIGLQITSALNYTKKLNGYQIAMLNIVDTVESGMPIGLFSFVKKGFHRYEVYSNEVFYVNTAYKLGTKKLYSSIRLGYDFSERVAVGYGIGSQRDLSPKIKLNMELSSDMLIETSSIDLQFSSDMTLGSSTFSVLGTLNKITTSFDYNISRRLSIFAGPSLNVTAISEKNNSFVNIAPYSFYNKTFSNTQVKMWVGGIFGASFTL